jgi:membrane protein DedA with SNARE-associated domain
VVRTFISLPAGIAGMRPLRFGAYTTIGCIPWTAALAGAGYAVGTSWQQIPNAFHTVTYVIAAVVVVALAVGIWIFVVRARRAKGGGDAGARHTHEAERSAS